MLPTMQSDIVFTRKKDNTALIKEAAYGEKVSGMLLYARTEEEIQPDNTYQMSGNRISVKTLDLNIEFERIAEQLNLLSENTSKKA